MKSPFALSHHRPADYHRCVAIGGVHLCARCLGLYPVLFSSIGVQIALRSPLHWAADPWIAFLLPAPAMVDWARGRLDPRTGTNFSRLLTGVLLGLSLGRTLYLHLRRPGFALTMAQLVAMAAIFLAVEVFARLRPPRADPNASPAVEDPDRSGPEP